MSSSAQLYRPTALTHGADYYPERWRHVPGIWNDYMRLLKNAKPDRVSLVFSPCS